MRKNEIAYNAILSDLVTILGKKYINEEINSHFDFIKMADKGISAQILQNFRKHFGIPVETTADYLNTSGATLYRWIKNSKKLDSTFSVKIFELTSLFLFGEQVFGNKENFHQWLKLNNTALGGMTPEKLILYPEGIAKIRTILGRIEHGVYS